MQRAVQELLPGVRILSRPRLSKLTFAGDKKMTRLPRRSAIVAFSAEDVYAIAEWIRRQRGGAAVVLGALSPAHPQRPGRAVPERRRRLHRRDRRHRHGPQPRRRSHRLRRRPQIRRLAASPSDSGRIRPDRRARRPPPARRHVRHDRPLPALRRRTRRSARGSSLRPRAHVAMAQRDRWIFHRSRISSPRSTSCRGSPD